MTTPGILGLELLDPEDLQQIAQRWGAPSHQASTLERFLMAPIQIHRRMEGLSEAAREALTSLLEACRPEAPLETLREGTPEELLDALLITVQAEDEPFLVQLPEPVALAALDLLECTPCRLLLLLRRLSPEALVDMLQALLGDLSTRHSGPRVLLQDHSRDVLEILTDPEALGDTLHALPRESSLCLRDLLDRGGALPHDQLGDSLEAEGAIWAPLLRRGLVWRTAHDVRIPVEVIGALLRLRLQRQVHRAAVRWTALRRQASRDNVYTFPTSPANVLRQLTGALEAAPEHTLPRGELLEALPSLHPDALLELAEMMDLVQPYEKDRQELVRLTHAGSELARNATADNPILQRLLMYLLDIPALPRAEAAARQLFGPDAPDEEGEEDEEEMDAGAWLDTMAPHLLDVEEATELHRYRGARSQQLLRILLQQLLNSLEVGCIIYRTDLERVVEILAQITRTLHRLEGRPYLRELRSPTPSETQQGVALWLESAALPLGWQAPCEEEATPRAESQPVALSLFDPPTRPIPIGPPALGRCMRVLTRAPAADAHGRWFLRTLSPELASWLGALVMHKGKMQKLPDAADPEDPAPAGGLREQWAAFARELQGNTAQMAERLVEFLLGQTAARHLEAVQATDVRRFLLCWLPLDARARSLPHLRAAFDALQRLSTWARQEGIELQLDTEALRRELEGPLLRTCSAEAAFERYHNTQPPPEMLRQLPEGAHDGLSQVVELEPGAGWFVIETSPGRLDSRLRVQAAPRPLGLLQRGDLLDGQFIRYGRSCWLTALRHIYLEQAWPLMR